MQEADELDRGDLARVASGNTVERPEGRRAQTGEFVERFALLVLLAAVFIAFSFASDRFLTAGNLQVVFATKSVLVVVALATVVPLVGGQFDLSVASVMGTASVGFAAAVSRYHAPIVVAAAVGIAIGLLVGLFNGLVITRIKVNSLIVTLGVSTILPGIVTWYTNGLTIQKGIPASFTGSATGNLLGVPRSMYWVVPVIVVVWFVLTQTPWGRYLASVGSSHEAARLTGIAVDRIVLTSFLVSGGLGGFAGILTVARQGSANPQDALGSLLLPALAAVFLGATAFRPGHYNVPGTVVAVFFVAFSVSGLQLLGAATWVEPVFNGSALVIAVALSTLAAQGRLSLTPLTRARRARAAAAGHPTPDASTSATSAIPSTTSTTATTATTATTSTTSTTSTNGD